MPEANGFILGFDPGGEGKFGWSICRVSNGQLQPLPNTGLADDAWDALLKVKQELGRYSPSGNHPVLAAGIDAPMFWSQRGNRTVDDILRDKLKNSLPKIRVLAVNSLWGAVLVQGVLLGKYLRDEWTDLKITEAHPNALWYLLRHSGQPEVVEMVEHAIAGLVDDTRDATLSAVAAWAMIQESQLGWQNLHERECHPVHPFDTPVSYWMPIP